MICVNRDGVVATTGRNSSYLPNLENQTILLRIFDTLLEWKRHYQFGWGGGVFYLPFYLLGLALLERLRSIVSLGNCTYYIVVRCYRYIQVLCCAEILGREVVCCEVVCRKSDFLLYRGR